MKRRDFLGCWGAAGALGVAAPTALLAASTTRSKMPGDAMSRERFAALLNTRFLIHAGDASLVTALVAVEDLPQTSAHVQQFAIVLQGESGAQALTAGSYAVSHRELGTLAMYLDPSAQPGGYRVHFGLLT